jgi:hypothetical protein
VILLKSACPFPFDRHSKRVSMPVWIAADGPSMKPSIAVCWATVEQELCYYAYSAANVLMYRQLNVFTTHALLTEWTEPGVFPTVAQKREQFLYQGRPVLLLDCLGRHMTDAFHESCGQRNIKILAFPPTPPINSSR